jgi:hypothetical protein
MRADKQVPAKGFDWIPGDRIGNKGRHVPEMQEIPSPDGIMLRVECPYCSGKARRPIARSIPKATAERRLAQIFELGWPEATLTMK